MSSFAGYCGACGKHVMHKVLFGTLHVCVPLEERTARATQLQQNIKTSQLNEIVKGTAASRPAKQGILEQETL